jgi:hypothetical protein
VCVCVCVCVCVYVSTSEALAREVVEVGRRHELAKSHLGHQTLAGLVRHRRDARAVVPDLCSELCSKLCRNFYVVRYVGNYE